MSHKKSIYTGFILLAAALLLAVVIPTLAEAPKTRVYEAPDLGYSFEYPLDVYSVRPGNTLGGTDYDILFPGVITIDPNDSAIYGDEPGPFYKVSIAAADVPDDTALDSSLFGRGILIQYDSALVDEKKVKSIMLGDVPALRIDELPIGPAGSLTADIVALDEGLLYEIIVEPVGQFQQEGGSVANRNLFESILKTFTFAEHNN